MGICSVYKRPNIDVIHMAKLELCGWIQPRYA